MCTKFIGYFRVSAEKQGRSGLGLSTQEQAVASYLAGRGADAKLLASYTEVESGKQDARPQLAKAIEHAGLTGARLLIAKLDTLSRDAAFLLNLQKGEVKFTACDMPQANEMIVGIMAVVAQAEREMISKRTKEALAFARARIAMMGQRERPDVKRLGNPNGAAHLRGYGTGAAVTALRASTRERAAGFIEAIDGIRAQGVTSANGIAAALNAGGIATPRGGKWTARSVLNVLGRLPQSV